MTNTKSNNGNNINDDNKLNSGYLSSIINPSIREPCKGMFDKKAIKCHDRHGCDSGDYNIDTGVRVGDGDRNGYHNQNTYKVSYQGTRSSY